MKNISLKDNIIKTIHIIKVIYASSKGFFLSFILQSIFTALFPYISIYFTYLIIDGIIDNLALNDILIYVYWMISLNLIVGLIRVVLTYMTKTFSIELSYNLDSKIASKTFELDYALVEDNETMKLLEMAEEGCYSNGGPTHYCEGILGGMLSSVLSIVYGIILMIPMLTIVNTTDNSLIVKILNNPYSALIILLALLIPAYVSKYIMKRDNEKSYEIMMYNINANRRSGYFFQIASNYKYGKDARLFQMQDMFIELMKELREEADISWRAYCIYNTKMMAISIFGNKALALIAYVFVGLKAMYGLISVGSVVSYMASITLLSLAITTLIERYSKLHLFNKYLDNYFTYLNLETKKEYGTINDLDINNINIKFDNVSFKYPNTNDYTLKNVNLEIKQGKKLAIVGPNGAGKTTIIKLLCRLYEPSEGEILINDIPIKDYTKEVCDMLFSVVFQDFKLFSYSIKDNVAAGLDGDDEKVIKTLKKTGLYDRVEKMSEGINTMIYQRSKEAGVEISGGEAQKLAISRALYKDSPIVILDEPTAALDPKSEAEIYENFNELVSNKTSVFISHRMSSCKFCDEIIVVDHGEIIEIGHHRLLLSNNGLYNKMWNAQAKYYLK
ncbi:ABC transporter ATP-binding protein [Candidatus Izimaplasma bacterium ZiA1]|uniref:ABC transporter ATP-binding protein n=1 Tax=Candidatus Izimoplasma sp. ZiA1 TaxID=2024899 RepID=UPI0014398079